MVAVVVVAAGRGNRMESSIPKQYIRFPDGKTILRHALDQIMNISGLTCVQVVIHPSDFSIYEQSIQGLDKAVLLPPVLGSDTRQQSVFAGLAQIEARYPDCQVVVVHDAARPFAQTCLFERAIEVITTGQAKAVYPATPVIDTLRYVDNDGGDSVVGQTLDRDSVHAVQTPQAFDMSALLDAHAEADKQENYTSTDDVALMQTGGHRVTFIEGSSVNFKITYPEDVQRAISVLRSLRREQVQVAVHA